MKPKIKKGLIEQCKEANIFHYDKFTTQDLDNWIEQIIKGRTTPTAKIHGFISGETIKEYWPVGNKYLENNKLYLITL